MAQNLADTIVRNVGIVVAAISTILTLLAPLVGLVVSACVAAGWLKADSGIAVFVAKLFPLSLHAQSGKPKLPPVGPAAVLLLAMSVAAIQMGCAGTFDESRLAHHATRKVAPVQISNSPRCIQLSDRARWEGALAKGGAVLTGTSGLAAIPFDGKGERIAIVGATVLLAAGTAVVVFLQESDAAAYIAEGCAQ